MIYITGDCHGNFERFNIENFPEQKEMTKDDYVIICGDFGFWTPSKEREDTLNELDRRPFTTLFVDGNHEDFDELNSFPVTMWHGGKAHQVRNSVIHLMRGQVFRIAEKTCFTFGGAASHDIQGGIYEVKDADKCLKKLNVSRKDIVTGDLAAYDETCMKLMPYRINHVSWWKEEVFSEAERNEAFCNLEAHNWKVDFAVTHDGPQSIISMYSLGKIRPDETRILLQEIQEKLDYRYWFFGHHHDNKNVTAKDIMLYEQIIQID